MLKHLLTAALAFAAGQAHAAPPSPLIGVWIEVNGPGMARIAPCARTVDALCATGLARRSQGAPAETGIVLSDVRPAPGDRWRGLYHQGKQRLPATLRLTDPDRVEMKVCLLLFCQSATYARRP